MRICLCDRWSERGVGVGAPRMDMRKRALCEVVMKVLIFELFFLLSSQGLSAREMDLFWGLELDFVSKCL